MGDSMLATPTRSRFAEVLGMKDLSGLRKNSGSQFSFASPTAEVNKTTDSLQFNLNVSANDVKGGEDDTLRTRDYVHIENVLRGSIGRGESSTEELYDNLLRSLSRRYASILENEGVPEEDRGERLRESIKETMSGRADTSSRVEVDDVVLEVMHAHRQDLQPTSSVFKSRPLSRTASNRSLNSRAAPSSPLMKSTLLPNIRRGSAAKLPTSQRQANSNANIALADSLSRPSSAADNRSTTASPLGSPARLSAFAMEFCPGGSGSNANSIGAPLPSPKSIPRGMQWESVQADEDQQTNSMSGKTSLLEDDVPIPELFADPDDLTDVFDVFDPFSPVSSVDGRALSADGSKEGELSSLDLLKAVVAGLPPEIAEAGSYIDEDFEHALALTNYNVEAALDLLLRGQEIDPSLDLQSSLKIPILKSDGSDKAYSDIGESPSQSASTSKGAKVCRHYLQGECRRSDCRFSHELNVVCRFWIQGRCTKSDCTFLHSLEGQTTDREDISVSQGSSETATASTSVKTPSSRALELDAFPGLPVTTLPAKHDPASPIAKTTQSGGVGFANVARRAPSGPVRVKELPQATSGSIGKIGSASRLAGDGDRVRPADVTNTGKRPSLPSRFPLVAPSCIPHLVTGSALNATYMKLRSQAADYARSRNACLQRAADAFRRGDSANAKALSVQGKEWDRKMVASHREAAQEIFETRHQAVTKRDGRGEVWIDLHGLHPSEAIEILESWLLKLEQENHYGPAYIVVGRSSHSRSSGGGAQTGGSGRGRLGKDVISFLQQWGYPMKEFGVGAAGGIIALDPGVHH